MNRLLTLALTAAAAYALGRLSTPQPEPREIKTFSSAAEAIDFLEAHGQSDLAAQLQNEVDEVTYGPEGAAQSALLELADEPYLGMPVVYLDRMGVSRGARISRIDDAHHRIVTLHVDMTDSDRPVTVEHLVPQQPQERELVHHWQPA